MKIGAILHAIYLSYRSNNSFLTTVMTDNIHYIILCIQ